MKRESAKVEKKESKKSSIRWAGFTAYTLGVFCLAFLVGMLSIVMFVASVGSSWMYLMMNIFIDLILFSPVVGIIFSLIQQKKNPSQLGKTGLIINVIILVLIIILIIISFYALSQIIGVNA